MKTQTLLHTSIFSAFVLILLAFFALPALAITYDDSSDMSCNLTSRKLMRGSRGTAVMDLQEILKTYDGEDQEVDGIFGRGTRARVISFQRNEGLSADGIVGSRTRMALMNWCEDYQINNDNEYDEDYDDNNDGRTTTQNVSFDNSFTLRKGDKAMFPDGMTVEVVSISDSRCKTGYTCIWAGEISTLLYVSGGRSNMSSREVRLGTSNTNTVNEYDYGFKLLNGTSDSITMLVSNSNINNNNNSTNKTVYMSESFTMRKGDRVSISGRSTQLTLDGIFSNSCSANQNSTCTADYNPVVRLTGGARNTSSSSNYIPLIAVGKTEQFDGVYITLQSIDYINNEQVAKFIIQTNSTSGSGNASANITNIAAETIGTSTARMRATLTATTYNNKATGYFEYGTSSGNLSSTSATTSYAYPDMSIVVSGLQNNNVYYYRPVFMYTTDSYGATTTVRGDIKSFTTVSTPFLP